MSIKPTLFLLFAVAVFIAADSAYSQSSDGRGSLIPKADEDNADHPKNFKETLEKLRIQKEKKDFAEMLERGEEALKLTEEVEKAYDRAGRLDQNEITKLAAVEKLVKKIRSELGGDDDDGDEENVQTRVPEKESIIKSFRSTAVKLLDELKKSSRFTVSAAAIQASNAVLKITRILRISK